MFLQVAGLLLFSLSSCSSTDVYEGTYMAIEENSQKCKDSHLELMEKGMAVWRIPGNEVSFRWNIKGDEIWLSTKSGGIIIGKIQNQTIEVSLPGTKTECFFKKVLPHP